MAEELTLSSFHVWYNYQASSQQLLDSWQVKQMTGLKLSWFIEDNNGTKVTERMAEKPTDWRTEPTKASYMDERLVMMVEIARQARVKNMSREELIDRVIQENIVKTFFL